MFCNGTYAGGPYGGPNFFMMIPMILILLMVVYFIHKAISSKNITPSAYDASLSRAMGILKERFAKGEINQEEYMEKKEQLQK